MSNGITRLVLTFHSLSARAQDLGFRRLSSLIAALGRAVTNVEIDPTAKIAQGLTIKHGQGLVIGPGVVLGKDCVLHQGVALGAKNGRYPTVGNGVTIYPGAKIFGRVHIGDGAEVGANAVVTRDVPSGDVVAGVPARSVRPTS